MADKKKSEEQESGKKGNNKLLLIVAAAVLALGVGAGAYFLGNSQAGANPTPVGSEVSRASGGSLDQVGPMVDVEPFIVNILDDDGTRYLKAAITLETEGQANDEIQKRMPQLRDAILLVAGNKTFNELRDLQGKLQLRAELLGRLNEILKTTRVKRIYFTEFVVQ